MAFKNSVDSIDMKLLQLPWKLDGKRLVLEGVAKTTAQGLIKKPGFYERIALLVRQAGAEMAQIKSPGMKHGFRVPAASCDLGNSHKIPPKIFEKSDSIMTELVKKPSMFIGVIELGLELRPQIDYILSNPDKKLALTRISDNAQLMLSRASAEAFKSDGKEAVKRKTSDFWRDEDLAALQQMYRDYGSVGFELTYQASLDKPKTDPTAAWGRFTTRYQLVEDEFGIVYRQGEILELVEIEKQLITA